MEDKIPCGAKGTSREGAPNVMRNAHWIEPIKGTNKFRLRDDITLENKNDPLWNMDWNSKWVEEALRFHYYFAPAQTKLAIPSKDGTVVWIINCENKVGMGLKDRLVEGMGTEEFVERLESTRE